MRRLQKQSGSTMAEVLVALVVVMAMMTVFAAAVTTSVDLIRRSKHLIETDADFQRQQYRTDAETTVINGDLSLTDADGNILVLPNAQIFGFSSHERTQITVGHTSKAGGTQP